MKHYSLTVKLSDEGFKDELETNTVIEYEENKYIKYRNSIGETTEWNPRMDTYLIGRLETYEPSVTVSTLDFEKLDSYKTEIRTFIKNNLSDRKSKIEELMQISR